MPCEDSTPGHHAKPCLSPNIDNNGYFTERPRGECIEQAVFLFRPHLVPYRFIAAPT